MSDFLDDISVFIKEFDLSEKELEEISKFITQTDKTLQKTLKKLNSKNFENLKESMEELIREDKNGKGDT
tara:strand:- start:302 stop:511 length:210 start_codon:yes stop_codon:yes gene_type:complete